MKITNAIANRYFVIRFAAEQVPEVSKQYDIDSVPTLCS